MSTVLVWALLGLAVALTFVSAIGVLVMDDALQRLHYVSPAATLGALLIGAALAIHDPRPAVLMKGLVVVVLLFATNAVVAHATGRAVFLRQSHPSTKSDPTNDRSTTTTSEDEP
jgi:multicomponent Na+:H+ antiporter subunit G